MNMTKKNVGLITMHRVLNAGSALQAYALQRKVQDLGYQCEIIDYVFPNKKQIDKECFLASLKRYARVELSNLAWGFPTRIRKKRFQNFYNRFYSLTPKMYTSPDDLHTDPPSYDVYLTGSDQVWNPRHIKDDTTFFLSFCKKKTAARISFASSFATNHIPDEYKKLYSRYLDSYNQISVRENTGVGIVAELTGKKAEVVCDPTLLLDGNQWSQLAELSSIKIKRPYILAYVLSYSFNPYPQIDTMIDQLQKQVKMPVIYLNGRWADRKKGYGNVIKSAGPFEFLWLFQNADYVITTSLHGTAFALNFQKPFYSMIENSKKDSRILSLLQLAGAQNRAKLITDKHINFKAMDYKFIGKSLETLRTQSTNYLQNALKS